MHRFKFPPVGHKLSCCACPNTRHIKHRQSQRLRFALPRPVMEPTTVPLHLPDPARKCAADPLPPLIQTPSGLAFLELQGSFRLPQTASSHDDGASDPIPLGTIYFPDYKPGQDEADTAWTKKVYMYIDRGMRTTGVVKKLPKAVAVVRKKTGQPEGSNEELEVMEIVKYKLLFSERPEPIGAHD